MCKPLARFTAHAGLLAATLILFGLESRALDLEPDFRKPEDYSFTVKLEKIRYGGSDNSQNDFLLAGPIFRTDEHVASLTLRGHETQLPRGGENPQVPGLLSARLLGASYYHHSDREHTQGLLFSIGSASDQPFAGPDVKVINLTGIIRYPSSLPHRGWQLMVNLSNDRPAFQATPLPGIAYFISNAEGTSTTVIGFPFIQFQSQLIRRTHLDLIVFPWALVAHSEYAMYDNLSDFIQFNFSPQVYLQHDRSDLSERLFFEEKTVEAGSRLSFSPNSFAAFSLGYAFGRSFYKGQSIYQISGGRHSIPDSAFFKVAIQPGI